MCELPKVIEALNGISWPAALLGTAFIGAGAWVIVKLAQIFIAD